MNTSAVLKIEKFANLTKFPCVSQAVACLSLWETLGDINIYIYIIYINIYIYNIYNIYNIYII